MATKKQEKQETQVAILTPKKVRGTATIYACGDVEFKAYGAYQLPKCNSY